MSSEGTFVGTATPAPSVTPPAPKPDIITQVETKVQQIEVAVENAVHTVIVKVEAGWTWVEGEFVHLENEAKAAYEWVQKEDPVLAAQVRQLFLSWEAKAAAVAQAKAGALGGLVTNVEGQIETHVANFVQGTLGAVGGAEAKNVVLYLATKGEGLLGNLMSSVFAKVVGALVQSQQIVGG